MPSFVHTPLLWGLLLVGVPILIHLINLLRHKRVPWAAMEFLLESQRKNQNWVRLKQLLLLLLRVLAIAAGVLMFARPVLQDDWLRMLSGGLTHHLILLDDSFSMGDRSDGPTTFSAAKEGLTRLLAQIGQENSPQAVTLLRFSMAQSESGPQPDLLKQRVGAESLAELEDRVEALPISYVAVDPLPALQAIAQLVDDSRGDACLVHVFSDYRQKDWERPDDLRAAFDNLATRGARINLVACAESDRPNLAVTKLVSAPGVQVAGVPMVMEAEVRNFGPAAARQAVVSVMENGELLQSVVFDAIPSGGAISRTFPVNFSTSGIHRLSAQLPEDSLNADNSRFALVETAERVQSLLIADDVESGDTRAVSTALNPGGSAVTGIAPKIEPPSFLRDKSIDEFTSVFLLGCRTLDESAAARLEAYMRGGGGVACFLGPGVDVRYYNERLYQEGKGMLPAPLRGASELLSNRLEKTPDILFEKHPVFQAFAREDSPLVTDVLVEQYIALRKDWSPSEAEGVRAMARLSNGAPFALEKRFGDGKFILFTSTAGSEWNNWNRADPSFVVAMLELQSYLTPTRGRNAEMGIASAWKWSVSSSEYQQDAVLRRYGPEPWEEVVALSVKSNQLEFEYARTDRPGVYEATLQRIQGGERKLGVAVNVQPAEGDLRLAGSQGVAQALADVPYQWIAVGSIGRNLQAGSGAELTLWLLALVLLVLVGEQILAYSASSHMDRKGVGA